MPEARVQRLDGEGRPVGGPIPVRFAAVVTNLRTAQDEADLGSLKDFRAAAVSFSVSARLTAKSLKRLSALLYPDHLAYLRHRHYLNVTRGDQPAPRRRNKHGRKGVRR